ncbi:DeoR/GlpR family DNA-binding transcription regulator [Paenibacillus massiliensis]|uniref:DeoR/GlpR family DNA-binding transcription regulator n=1 Tax=Paenibacillus massiliensis TaxID=225917 RepID=UPI00037D4013|nr:DeoR/GlpR family DNA-binding transcription regulator [Paenibacillus massiliensis]
MLYEEERKPRLLQYIQQNQRASVQVLSEVFQVSESTIRRDLKELEEAQLLKRTHGGAVSLESANIEPAIIDKEDLFREEKAAIAREAAELIRPGDTLLLDAGTTTLHLAREIRRMTDIRVVTNSLLVLNELKDCRDIEVSLTGGMLRPETQAFVGPITEAALDMIRVDKAFIAMNGIDARAGLTTPNMVEAAAKRKMMDIANEVVLLADHSKFGKVAFAKVAELSQVHHGIFDKEVPENSILAMRKLGIVVTIV